MLRELLNLLETAGGPVSLPELSRRLDLDAGVLAGMLDYWVRKGRLIVDDRSAAACACSTAGCGCGTCAGSAGCPFIARLPKSYRLVPAIEVPVVHE